MSIVEVMNDCWMNSYFVCSEEQLVLIRNEFLDLYILYHTQMVGLSETFADEIYYLVRVMVENFEDENPYKVCLNATYSVKLY